ncbi:hypothetical protein SASPL_155750 [Salvia splendens]|uniref:Uncharacterized protein n=1 Tax=Salvia splendens TaxID=180675 RepID=A0A8X8VXU1_SALSN|nr:hypothetical protein SASPL_155750 [Salvia splendens]
MLSWSISSIELNLIVWVVEVRIELGIHVRLLLSRILKIIEFREVNWLTSSFAERSLSSSMIDRSRCFGCICYLGLLNGLLLLLMWNAFVMMVLEMESVFASLAYCREDLASWLRSVQVQEKREIEFSMSSSFRYTGHKCMHIQQITEESGTKEAEPDSEYDNALKEAVKGMQDAVISITVYLEEVR